MNVHTYNGKDNSFKILVIGLLLTALVLIGLAVFFGGDPQKRTTPPPPVPTTHKSQADIDFWQNQVNTLDWRIKSATNSGNKAAQAGDKELADKWAVHIGQLEQQLEQAKRNLEAARDKAKEEEEKDK